MPVGVDWYVYDAGEALWPTDCLVMAGREAVGSTDLGFSEWNSLGDRGTPASMTPEERTTAHASMAVIAGKYIARRSPDAAPMIGFLTGQSASEEPLAQVAALEAFIRRSAGPALSGPMLRYVTEVRAALDDGPPLGRP